MIDFDALLRNYAQILELARTAKEVAAFLYPGDEACRENFEDGLRIEIFKRVTRSEK